MSQGAHTVTWTPSGNLPKGQYFFRVQSDDGHATSGKLVLVR